MSTSGGPIQAFSTPSDAYTPATLVMPVYSELSVWNGTAQERVRTPTTFKDVSATAAGATGFWVPAAGKKFRLMRYRIDLAANAAQAVAGQLLVTLKDAGTALAFSVNPFVPGAAGAVAGWFTTGWVNLGNGFLSAAANNVLSVNLAAALTAGSVVVNVAGTEE